MIGLRKITPDRSKINIGMPAELKSWSRSLKVPARDIQRAIDKVGQFRRCRPQALGLAIRR